MNEMKACPGDEESAVARQAREECLGPHVGLECGRCKASPPLGPAHSMKRGRR